MGFFSRFQRQPPSDPMVEGLLGYYGLGEWWLTAFTPQEREQIESIWGYITFLGSAFSDERPLTRGHVTSNPLSPAEFLMVMSRRVSDGPVKNRILAKVRELRGGDLPGYINSTHYTAYMEQAKQLIQSGRQQEADPIVDKAFTAFEDFSRIGPLLTEHSPVPPGSYREFAVLYRKLKDYEREVGILERFTRQKHQTGGASGKALERLEKARALRDSVTHNNPHSQR